MIVYNVTINIDKDVVEEWVNWMKDKHIPDVMATGLFIENRFCKILVDEEQGESYSVQYLCKDMNDYNTYQEKHAPALQRQTLERYPNKFVAFRTLLEIL